MNKIIATFFALMLIAPPVFAQTSIPTIDQFAPTTTPVSGITQRTYGKALIFTGITTGTCLSLDSNHQLTTTACGSGGGGGGDPFTHPTSLSSATTSLLLLNGNASTTQFSVFTKAYFGGSATTTIDSAGNIVIPSGSGLTITGKTDGCATFATGLLNSTGVACGSGGGGADPFTHPSANVSATTSGLIISASSTISNGLFTMSGGASTTNLTASGNFFAAGDRFTIDSSTGNITKIGNTAVTMSGTSFQMGNSGGDILFQNNVSTLGSGIKFQTTPVVGGNYDIPSAIKFFIGTLERARFNGAGRFGIATTAPVAVFSIAAISATTTPLMSISTSTANSTSTVFFMDSNGWTGLATGTPGSIFSIGNVANFTYATTSFYSTGGINLTSGCFSINNTCITGGTSAASGGDPFTHPSTNVSATTSGLIITASTTIGDGTQTGGLTISGGSTTTLKAYFQSPVGINGISNRGAFGGNGVFTINGDASNAPVHEFFRPISSGASNVFSMTFGDTSNSVLGQINGRTDTSGSTGALQFMTSNGSSDLERLRIDSNGNVGIATTTPFWNLTVASSTGPQFALLDGSATNFAWTQRAAGNNFYIASSSNSSSATSSVSAFSINGTTGAFTFNSGATSTFSSALQGTYLNLTGTGATSTFAAGLNIAKGCFAINGTCLTTGTVTNNTINAGYSGWSTSTPYGSQLLLYPTNGTEDVVFGRAGSGATTSAPFWWDVNATTTYIGNGGTGDSITTYGAVGNEWTMGSKQSDNTFRLSSSTILGTNDVFAINKTNLNVGFGTSTPWAKLSIVGASPPPEFAIASTTGATPLFYVDATTSRPTGVAVNTAYLYTPALGLLDQFTVNGRINTGDTHFVECAGLTVAPVAAASANGCGPFRYGVDTTSVGSITNLLNAVGNSGLSMTAVTAGNSTLPPVVTSIAVANSGAGLFFPAYSNAANEITLATSTPAMEAYARIAFIQNATSSLFIIGFNNISSSGAGYEVEPTSGCFFEASSTSANGNWYAVNRNASVGTYVDTGFASSTIVTGTGSFLWFRVEGDNSGCRYYMGSVTSPRSLVANIVTNVPVNVGFNVGIYSARLTGGLVTPFIVGTAKAWFTTPYLNY